LLTDNDLESYTINGKTTDTLAIITGVVASIISIFVPQATIWKQIAVAIISSVGGSAAGGAIGVVFSEPVAVEAYYYSLTGYDYTSGRYTSSYSGIARRVVTKNSSAYDEWFYDGFTPRNWKDNTLAYWFWSNLNGGDQYPGVKVYA